MKTNARCLATMIVLAMSMAPPAVAASRDTAVSKADVAALQAQLEQLAHRLDRLEATNAQLRSENAALEALHLSRSPERSADGRVRAIEVENGTGAEWTSRIKARGDLRVRYEHLESERDVDGAAEDAANRDRQRVRARLGFDAAVTDTVRATLLLATGGDDPRGTNQTFGGTSSRKPIGLDLAYVDWRFTQGGSLALGKQPYPVWRPAHSLFLDSDVNPEGGSVRFTRGAAFANAYGFWVSEQYDGDPDGANTDTGIFGLQTGVKLAALGGETTLAVNYYVCGACRDHSPLYANNANGNTTYRVGALNVLKYGYEILDLSAQVATTIGETPFVLTAGYARNVADDVEHDAAYAFGAHFGRASGPGTWELGALYQSIDKDALFGQVVDSDFGDGRTDSEGWVLKAGYVPVKNVSLNTQLFLNTLNKDVGTELDFTRLQLDVNYRF